MLVKKGNEHTEEFGGQMTNQQMWEEILVKAGFHLVDDIKEFAAEICPPTLDNLFSIGVKALTEQGYHVETYTYARMVDGVWGRCSWASIHKERKVGVDFSAPTLAQALLEALHKALVE